jgi:hypothetical protein
MPICAVCDTTFRAKRLDAKTCSAKCRKASSRCPRTVQGSDVTHNPGESTSPADVTDNDRPTGDDPRLSGEPFTFDKDTIVGRRGRVVDGWLQSEALGGGKDLFSVWNVTDLNVRLAWLSGLRVQMDDLDQMYGTDRHRNDLAALRPPMPKWGKRGSPGWRRLPSGSRPTHAKGLAYIGTHHSHQLVAA